MSFALPPTFNAGKNYYPSSPATVDQNRHTFINANIWVQMWDGIGNASITDTGFENFIGDESREWPGTPEYPEFDPYSLHEEVLQDWSYTGSTDYREVTTVPGDETIPPNNEKIVCTGNPTLGPLWATLLVNIRGEGDLNYEESKTYTPDPDGESYIITNTTPDADLGFGVSRYVPGDVDAYIALGFTSPLQDLWVITSGVATEQHAWNDFDTGAAVELNFSETTITPSPGTPDITSWSKSTESESTIGIEWTS